MSSDIKWKLLLASCFFGQQFQEHACAVSIEATLVAARDCLRVAEKSEQ
jgi:hypothetical protein